MALTYSDDIINLQLKTIKKRISELENNIPSTTEKVRWGISRVLVNTIRNLTTDSNGLIAESAIFANPDSIIDLETFETINLNNVIIQTRFNPELNLGVQIGAVNDVKRNLSEYLIQTALDNQPVHYYKFERSDGTVCANMPLMNDEEHSEYDHDLTKRVVDRYSSMVATISQLFLYKVIE